MGLTEVTQYGDIKIFVNGEGQFVADVNDNHIVRDTLQKVMDAIDRNLTVKREPIGAHVIYLEGGRFGSNDKVSNALLMGINANDKSYRMATVVGSKKFKLKESYHQGREFVPYSEKRMQFVSELNNLVNAARKQLKQLEEQRSKWFATHGVNCKPTTLRGDYYRRMEAADAAACEETWQKDLERAGCTFVTPKRKAKKAKGGQ